MRPLDFSKPALHLHNKARAFSPFPTVTSQFGDQIIKIDRTELAENSGNNGEVVAIDQNSFTIACGQGGLKILQAQRPGKPMQPAGAVAQGLNLKLGDVFK